MCSRTNYAPPSLLQTSSGLLPRHLDVRYPSQEHFSDRQSRACQSTVLNATPLLSPFLRRQSRSMILTYVYIPIFPVNHTFFRLIFYYLLPLLLVVRDMTPCPRYWHASLYFTVTKVFHLVYV